VLNKISNWLIKMTAYSILYHNVILVLLNKTDTQKIQKKQSRVQGATTKLCQSKPHSHIVNVNLQTSWQMVVGLMMDILAYTKPNYAGLVHSEKRKETVQNPSVTPSVDPSIGPTLHFSYNANVVAWVIRRITPKSSGGQRFT